MTTSLNYGQYIYRFLLLLTFFSLFPYCKNSTDMTKKKQIPVVEAPDTMPIPQNTEGVSEKNKAAETALKDSVLPSKPPLKPSKSTKEKATKKPPKPPQAGSVERRMEDYINSRKPVDDTTKN